MSKTNGHADPDMEAGVIDWFTKTRDEALSAMHALESQMTDLEKPIAAELIVSLMSVFEREKTPLPCILYATAKMYGMSLHLALQNMAEPEEQPKPDFRIC